jgi:predicted aldo/keto reductase-like oxidoreductase
MKYRKFGNLNFKVSALGFGAMRLPHIEDTSGGSSAGEKAIDEKEAIRMIRHAIDEGVNYIDTAYGYHNGKSEIVTGKALKDGYRSKVALATKSPVWLINKPEDFDRLLDEQLQKLDTDYIDFYLLHALDAGRWRNIVLKHNLLERAEAAKEAGKIKHIGFSFHDDIDVFKEIVDGYDKWEFCQIQYNYMDINNQAGTEGLKYAASKGIAVVIMEPMLGGKLANPPQDVKAIMDAEKKDWSPSRWALQWLWSQPEVSVVLSGMSNMQQVEDNLNSASNYYDGPLSPADRDVIDRVYRRYEERAAIPCTACRYCMPCPNNVDIPRNFSLYNDSIVHEDLEGSQRGYRDFMDAKNRAGECVQCRICEDKCPQRILISEWMPKVHEALK